MSSANPNNVDAVVSEDADAAELRAFGYWQQLRRSMGVFSSFAISFSMVSIITGVFAHFDFGFKQAGPTVLWSWSVVGAGQFLIALVLADLSSRIPLSGSGYQWSTRLVNPHYGFFVGWLILMQLLTGFPGVCHTLATALCNSLGAESNSPALVVGVAVGTISAIALVHLVGIRVVSFVNDLGVMAEVAACSLLIVVLFGAYFLDGPASLSRFLDRTHAPTGQPAGPSALALSLLMGAWCLTGFEAAADLAEETRQPRRVVPGAILTSLLGSGVAGFLLLSGVVLAIRDLPAAQHRPTAPGHAGAGAWRPVDHSRARSCRRVRVRLCPGQHGCHQPPALRPGPRPDAAGRGLAGVRDRRPSCAAQRHSLHLGGIVRGRPRLADP